jgi:hypothetical protein
MRGRLAHASTKYKSLYPTDSGNQEIAIPRIATDCNEGAGERIAQEGSPATVGFSGVRREFRPGTADLNNLIEALYELVSQIPDSGTAPAPSNAVQAADSACISARTE